MPCLFSFCSSCRTISDHLHPFFLCFNGDVNVHIVDTRMREQPHDITLIKVVAFHDLCAIPFYSFKENKLVYPHLSGDMGKKTKRQFYHRVKADKSTDP